jgi:hypothetical protein
MGGACGTDGENINAYLAWVGRLEEKRNLRRPELRENDNIIDDVKRT